MKDYTNPILIATDWNSFNFIKRHRGLCLLCEKENWNYDFDFCFGREVWVLYAQHQKFHLAISLAHVLQGCGADKVILIPVRGAYGKC